MNVTTKFHWMVSTVTKIVTFFGAIQKKPEIPAKTGTGSGNKRVQNFRHVGRIVHTKFQRDGFSGYKDIIGYMGNYGKKPEVPAKTGTGSGNMRVQNFRHISRNVHTKFHQDGFRGYKDIRNFVGWEEEEEE